MNDEILRFVEPVYRFCLKRLSSHADAEDLAQEILLCVLQGCRNTDVGSLDGYVWKIAHNRYAKRIDAKKRDVTVLYGDEYLSGIPEEEDEEEPETHEEVFRALHTLGAAYRDILVDYYVRNLDVRAISVLRGLSAERVKWRLHTGREKIRDRMGQMEKSFEKIDMHVMCNGSFGPNQYLDTQLYRAVAKACYEEPLTIEEISLTTGVPTLYLEDALEHMLWGDALEKVGQKYATNFIITTKEQIARMRGLLRASVVSEAVGLLSDYVGETEKGLRSIGFYGSDFPLSRLLPVAVPAILYAASEKARAGSSLLPKERPPRKDGGSGWFIVTEGIDRADEGFAGCNGYSFDAKGGQPGRFVYYWTGGVFDDKLNQTLHSARFFLNAIGPDGALLFSDDADAARAFANGLCENRNCRAYPAMPVFTGAQYALFSEWAKGFSGMDVLWEKWIDSLFRAYRAFTPKRLTGQIGGNVDSFSFNLSAFVLSELQARGFADRPGAEKVFTKNLLLIRG